MTVIESEVKDDPMFSFKNFFKPTTKNVQIWSLAVKGACVTVLANAVMVATTNITLACIIGGAAIFVGGLAEAFVLFTRQKPEESLQQAVVDVTEEIREENYDS